MSSSQRSRGGLPARKRMRHDAHYVDVIAGRFEEPVGKLVPTDAIAPNPFQPRTRLDELDELIASVQHRGILEPLIVRRDDEGQYQLVSGERRLRAAEAVGMKMVPCVELDIDDGEALEVALVENIIRRDLDVFEEADGLAALKDRFEYTHADLSEKLGRSRVAVTESLTIAQIPEPVRELCFKKGVLGKAQLLQVARAGDRQKMEATVLRIADEGATRDEVAAERRREEKPQRGRPKAYAFRWQAPDKKFAVQLKFKKSRVSRDEVIDAVRSLLEELEAEAG